MASKGIGRLVVTLTALTKPFTKGMSAAGAVLTRFGNGVRNIIASMARMATAMFALAGPIAVVAGLIAATRAGMDFEQQMANVAAITGKTQGELEGLSNLAKELGSTTQFSASQAAQAAENFSLAGFSIEQTMAALPATLDLAAAGSLDMATASDIAAQVMSQMALSAGDLGRVVDVMAKAFTTSNTDLTLLGESFKAVGVVGRNANQTIEQIGAALQVMANVGIRGGESGTALRNIFLRLQNGGEGVAKMLQSLGVNIEGADGKMKPLSAIVDELNSAFAGMTDVQRNSAISTLAGVRATAAFGAVLDAGGDKLRSMEEALRNSAGTAQEIARKKMDTLKGAFTRLSSAAEGLGIALFESAGGGLRSIVEAIASAIGTLTKFIPFITGLFKPVGDLFRSGGASFSEMVRTHFVGALEYAAPIINTAVSAIVSMIRAVVGAARDGFVVVGDAIRSLAQVLFGTTDTMANMRNTMIGAFVAMEFGFRHWKEIASAATLVVMLKFVKLGANIKHILMEVIPTALANAGAWIMNHFTNIAAFLGSVFSNLFNNVKALIENLPDLIRGSVSVDDLWTPLTDGFEKIEPKFKEIPERVAGPLEQQLTVDAAAAVKKLGGKFSAFHGNRMAEIDEQSQKFKSMLNEMGKASNPEGGSPGSPGSPTGDNNKSQEAQDRLASAMDKSTFLQDRLSRIALGGVAGGSNREQKTRGEILKENKRQTELLASLAERQPAVVLN